MIVIPGATDIIGARTGNPGLPYVRFSDEDTIRNLQGMGISRSVAVSFVELSHGFDKGIVTTTTIDSLRPNAPTSFSAFVDEVFVPMFKHAA